MSVTPQQSGPEAEGHDDDERVPPPRDPRKVERLMPPPFEYRPAVQASSYASWNDFGAWWWNLIEEEIQVSPERTSALPGKLFGLLSSQSWHESTMSMSTSTSP